MVYGTDRRMEWSFSASLMQIGQGAQRTGRAHLEVFSASGQQQFAGTAGSRDLWHSVQQRPSTWQQAWLHARLFGWGRSSLDCSGCTWSLLWFIVITIVALNSRLIQYFMIDPNTSTSSTIISDIVFSGESCYFHMFPRRIRMLTSWWRRSPGANSNSTEAG